MTTKLNPKKIRQKLIADLLKLAPKDMPEKKSMPYSEWIEASMFNLANRTWREVIKKLK